MGMVIIVKKPKIIIKNGKPHEVVLSIRQYKALLEKLEDAMDVAEVERIKKKGTSFRNLRDYMKDRV